MNVEYEKTYYERLVDVLEDAFFAGRDIKLITLTKKEYESIIKCMSSRAFIASISRKVYIKNLETFDSTNDWINGRIGYQVVEQQTQQSATLNLVALRII